MCLSRQGFRDVDQAIQSATLNCVGVSEDGNDMINHSSTRQNLSSLRLIALGDSVVYGYGDWEGGGWVERLRRHWMGLGIGWDALGEPILNPSAPVLYNLGIRGNTVEQVHDRLKQEFHGRGEVRHRSPDGILLSVGVNDSPRLGHWQGRNYTNFDQFQDQLDRLLTQAQSLGQVWFVGMIPVDSTRMPFLDCFYYNHSDQYRYKEVTRQACNALGIPYLDLFELWLHRGDHWWRSRLTQDGLHPNSLGHHSIFEDVLHWSPLQSAIPRFIGGCQTVNNPLP